MLIKYFTESSLIISLHVTESFGFDQYMFLYLIHYLLNISLLFHLIIKIKKTRELSIQLRLCLISWKWLYEEDCKTKKKTTNNMNLQSKLLRTLSKLSVLDYAAVIKEDFIYLQLLTHLHQGERLLWGEFHARSRLDCSGCFEVQTKSTFYWQLARWASL